MELTTGVVFLMSSLYGAGHASDQMNSMSADMQSGQATTTEQSSSINPMDPTAVEAYVKARSSDAPILVDIARCESTFRQFDSSGNVIRGKVNNADVGVLQINEHYHADEAAKLGMNLYTLEGNVQYAKHLYEKFGTDPWSSSSPCWGKTANALALKN